MDVPTFLQGDAAGYASVRIWGISLQEIGQASDLLGKNITVMGGMKKGLPLAKPEQAGLLVKGWIFQSFGNWIETDMTLDLVIAPGAQSGPSGVSDPAAKPGADAGGTGTLAAPKNFTLNWPAGQPLGVALANTLRTAFPGVKIDTNVSADLVRSNAETGYYPTLDQLADFARFASLDINKDPNYPGVGITYGTGTIVVSDGTVPAKKVKQIAFEDMIGQPTWLAGASISLKLVMRADLQVNDQIKLPPTLVQNTAASQSSLVNQRAAFQGTFTILNMRHVGNFRQPSADAWVTVIEAYSNTPTTGPTPLDQALGIRFDGQ